MAEHENKDLEIDSLEATEVEDADLEKVAGGATKEPPVINGNCNC